MISEIGKYYLYRHIRLDKNIPFYIGIGTKRISDTNTYERACFQKKRNSLWESIRVKTDYVVQILCESYDMDFIKEKEREFIFLYGRIDLKTGSLSNLTNGGDGIEGFKGSEEYRKRCSEKRKGMRISEDTKRKISIANKGKIKSPETIEKTRLKLIGRKYSKNVYEERSKKRVGIKRSAETCLKMSISQIPEEKRVEIKNMLEKGCYKKQICRKLNTSISAINNIIKYYNISLLKRY